MAKPSGADELEMRVAQRISEPGETQDKLRTEIIHRLRAEQDLLNLAAIVEQSNDAIIGQTVSGTITSWNRGAERVYGYSAAEAVGRSIALIYPPDRLPELELIFQQLAQGKHILDFETVRRTKGGRDLPVSLSVSPIRDAMGRMVAASVIARDISAQREAQEALRLSEERYRSLVGAITSVVWQTDARGRFGEPQSSWDQYTGQTWAEHQGWGWLRAIHPEDQARIRCVWKTSLEQAVDYTSQGRIWHAASRSYHYFEARGVPLFNTDGTVREWVGTLTDIHARHCAEAELHQLNARLEELVRERTAQLEVANKELEAFSYSVSHDLRAPLRAIDGFSQALVEEYQAQVDGQGRHYVDRVRAAARRMGQLIDDLLKLSSVSRSQLERSPINMSGCAREVLQELAQTRPEYTLEQSIQPGLVAHGDPRLIRIVLENLFDNAWKFTRKTPVPRVLFGKEDDWFFVRDNGAGFDMAYAEKLFGAFQRLHGPNEYEGTGIGLATVQRIIHRHGGAIRAEGKPGLGATFYFSLSELPLEEENPV